MATAEEMADVQSRVDAKTLMITAALPGTGDWGTQGDALAAEQAAVAEAQNYNHCWCGKSRSSTPGDVALPAAVKLELVG